MTGDVATRKFTTARSSFSKTIAQTWCRCSGCGLGIATGELVLERDFITKKQVTGKTRLHDRDDCYQEWELRVLEKLADRREAQQHTKEKHDARRN
jgi:hypothetical protein